MESSQLEVDYQRSAPVHHDGMVPQAGRDWENICKLYSCNECNFVTNEANAMARHRESDHKKAFKCPDCSLSFWKRIHSYNHRQSTHDVPRPFKCPMCPYEYSWKRHLLTHKRKSHGI